MKPTVVYVKKGQVTTFTCRSTSPTTWTFKLGNLPTNTWIVNDTSLTVSNIQNSNKGYYECNGTNENNYKFRSRVLLMVLDGK